MNGASGSLCSCYIGVPPGSVPSPSVTGLHCTPHPQPMSCLLCPSLSAPFLPGVGLAWDQLSEGEVSQRWLCKSSQGFSKGSWEKPFMACEKHMWGAGGGILFSLREFPHLTVTLLCAQSQALKHASAHVWSGPWRKADDCR